MSFPMLAEAIAFGPVDRRGRKCPEGKYVRLHVIDDGQAGHHWRIIPRQDADTLLVELREVLDRMSELAKPGSAE